jgi:hypothetical protein
MTKNSDVGLGAGSRDALTLPAWDTAELPHIVSNHRGAVLLSPERRDA